MICEMKRKPLGTAVPCPALRHSEKQKATPDLKETFRFPHGAVYCSSIASGVQERSQEQISKLFTSQWALDPPERQKRESRTC